MPALAKAVPRLVSRRLREVVATAGPALESGDRRDLHALRVAVKRLRYNLEFFRAILDPEAGDAIALLSRIQENLGTISDADRFSLTYAALRKTLPRGDPRRTGIRALKAAAAAERARALAELRTAWARGARNYPERLATSISAALGSLSPKSEPK